MELLLTAETQGHGGSFVSRNSLVAQSPFRVDLCVSSPLR